MTNEERKNYNMNAYKNPKPGDAWIDVQACIYFVVLELINLFKFIICDQRKQVDDGHYTFDLSKVKAVNKRYFNLVFYNNDPNHRLGFMLDHGFIPEFPKEWEAYKQVNSIDSTKIEMCWNIIKTEIDCDEILSIQARIDKINGIPLENLVIVKDGKKIMPSDELLGDWKYLGLSNFHLLEMYGNGKLDGTPIKPT